MNIVMSKSTTYSLESPKDPVLPSSFFTKPDKVGDSWLIPFKNGMIKGFLNLLDFDAGCPSRIYLRKKSVFILSFENFFILFSVFLFFSLPICIFKLVKKVNYALLPPCGQKLLCYWASQNISGAVFCSPHSGAGSPSLGRCPVVKNHCWWVYILRTF